MVSGSSACSTITVAKVGGQEENDIFTVNQAAFTVCHLALVKRTVEQVEYIRVRFFHFIEQHHRVGFLANRFGQDATFAIADIARRGTNQPRDGVFSRNSDILMVVRYWRPP